MMEVIICNLLIDESDPRYYWNVLVFLKKKFNSFRCKLFNVRRIGQLK